MKLSSKIQQVVTKAHIDDQPSDFAYWQTQPYETRLAVLEEIRKEYHAWRGNEGTSGMIASQDFKEFVQSLYDTRVEANIEGININFIDLVNLRKNKKAIRRLQDLADLENLQ